MSSVFRNGLWMQFAVLLCLCTAVPAVASAQTAANISPEAISLQSQPATSEVKQKTWSAFLEAADLVASLASLHPAARVPTTIGLLAIQAGRAVGAAVDAFKTRAAITAQNQTLPAAQRRSEQTALAASLTQTQRTLLAAIETNTGVTRQIADALRDAERLSTQQRAVVSSRLNALNIAMQEYERIMLQEFGSIADRVTQVESNLSSEIRVNSQRLHARLEFLTSELQQHRAMLSTLLDGQQEDLLIGRENRVLLQQIADKPTLFQAVAVMLAVDGLAHRVAGAPRGPVASAATLGLGFRLDARDHWQLEARGTLPSYTSTVVTAEGDEITARRRDNYSLETTVRYASSERMRTRIFLGGGVTLLLVDELYNEEKVSSTLTASTISVNGESWDGNMAGVRVGTVIEGGLLMRLTRNIELVPRLGFARFPTVKDDSLYLSPAPSTSALRIGVGLRFHH